MQDKPLSKKFIDKMIRNVSLRTRTGQLSVRPHPEIRERKRMLAAHIMNAEGTDLQMYLPYIQLGFPGMMTEQQRKDLWNAIEKIVDNTEQKHFKRFIQPEDYHDERVLAFYELAQERWDKSPAWVVTAYRKGFAYIEAVLQMRRLGIQLATNNIMEYKQCQVTFFVEYFTLRRLQEKEPTLTFEKKFYREHGYTPSKESKALWYYRCQHLESAINRCPHFTIYGFAHGLSFEDLLASEMMPEEDTPDV